MGLYQKQLDVGDLTGCTRKVATGLLSTLRPPTGTFRNAAGRT